MQRYIVQNIKLPIESSKDVVFANAKKRLLKLFGSAEIVDLGIFKRSIDARNNNDIKFVWSVSALVESKRTYSAEVLAKNSIVLEKKASLDFVRGNEKLSSRPVVVGFGPCGMFCALVLARNGYRPIIIERGKSVFDRARDVEAFYKTGELNIDSNIQFGAGGAGTFSDGKLVTRINDEKCAVVIDEMHRFGAPDDIVVSAKPHVGTDNLRKIVNGIHNEIINLGGEIHYETKFISFKASGGVISSVLTNRGEIPCGALVIAIGHSARDTFSSIKGNGVEMIPKPFSVGVRIEHLQENIDAALYGKMAGNPLLPKGEYNLSHKCKDGRGVYTFCMCPGGEVMAAASECGGVVTNGMSNYSRNGRNANSAVAVSVLPSDFGNTVEGAIAFQRQIERNAFVIGGGGYKAPASTVGDFLSGKYGTDFSDVVPSYMSGNVVMSGFDSVLPEFVIGSLREGLVDFDKKIKGFASNTAVLTGPETRTSSPLRISRNDLFVAEGFENLYPCGEGAGYAGGITSAATDGIACALKIMARYKE